MNNRLLFAVFAVFLFAFIVVAVDWYPAVVKESWHRRSSGFCSVDSQCLVSSAGSRNFDGMPEKYFSDTRPYCINNTQYILDFFCDNGRWTSRTKLLALQLLRIAGSQSPNDFSLFCAQPALALNNLDYRVNNVLVSEFFSNCHPHNSQTAYQCMNSVCVLKYNAGVAFGASLNIPVDDSSKSFLRALDKSPATCNSVKNDDNLFDSCGSNIWYNHNTESVIVMPAAYSGNSLPSVNIDVEDVFISQPFNILNDFSSLSNLSFFAKSGLFNNIYFAKKNNKDVFSFLERDQTEFGYDYIGLYINNININNFCEDVVFVLDNSVLCDDSNDFLVIAKKTPEINASLINLWADITAKLRLS